MSVVDETLQSIIDQANQLLADRKYDEIIPLVQPILVRETGGQAQRVYGMALVGQGKFQESIHILMTAAQMLPDDVTVAFAYGTAQNQIGQTEAARASFDRALGLNAGHPGAKLGYINTSKSLADRDEPTEPMRAIEWLYAAWQRDVSNAELADRILGIYIRNGWADSARQFANLLPAPIKNSDHFRSLIKDLPAEAPPLAAPAQVAAPAVQTRPTFEACPFCKQQVMMGVHTCPHCKMIIRAKSMPGADYKPEWQEVVLNILCWIGMIMGSITMLAVFLTGTQATPGGGFVLVIGFVQIFANLLVLQRQDFVMSIAKWLYVMSTIRCILCSCIDLGNVQSTFGKTKELMMFQLIITAAMGIYSAFMVYLLNYEGAD